MKLLMCNKCGDIFNLTKRDKSCGCGEVTGRYINNLDAEYSGDAQPIGFSNPSIRPALMLQRYKDKEAEKKQPPRECCKGVEFTAFFIPLRATSLNKVEK